MEENYEENYEDYNDFTVIGLRNGKKNGKKKENPNGHITSKHIRERERKIEYSLTKR